MRKPRVWTAAEDEYIIQSVHAKVYYDKMAAHLGVCRNTVIERRKKLQVESRLLPSEPSVAPSRDAPQGAARWPLPPGDPISWGAITQGTWLQGVPYPLEPSWTPSR